MRKKLLYLEKQARRAVRYTWPILYCSQVLQIFHPLLQQEHLEVDILVIKKDDTLKKLLLKKKKVRHIKNRVAPVWYEPVTKTHGPFLHCYGQRCEWNSTRHKGAAYVLCLFHADLSEQHPVGHQEQSPVLSRQSPEGPNCPLRLCDGAQTSPFRNWQVSTRRGFFNQNRMSD